MSGVTDAPFRRLAARARRRAGGLGNDRLRRAVEGRRECGCALRRPAASDRMSSSSPAAKPHWMAEGARIAEGGGRRHHRHQHGLPGASRSPTAQSGSALMRDLDHALTPDRGDGRAPCRVPVTLKMRLGWDDRSHQRAGAGAPRGSRRRAVITVHGRTRCQFYKGSADWARGARGQGRGLDPGRRQRRHHRRSTTPVRALDASGADAVMIGRGAQGRPWLPGQIGALSRDRRQRERRRRSPSSSR